MLGFGGQQLIDSGKITDNGTDTNMQIGDTSIKYMLSTTNVTAVIPSLAADGEIPVNLYTGYSPEQTSFAIITGEDGYVTASDNADWEVSDNGSIEFEGYLDSSSEGIGRSVVYKKDAFIIYFPTADNITAGIISSTGTTDFTANVTGDGAFTNIPDLVGAATHWQAVLTADDDTSYVKSPTGDITYYSDAYTVNTTALPDNININSVKVYFRITDDSGTYNGQAKPLLYLNGSTVNGTPVNSPNSYTTYNEIISRPGGGSWTRSDIDILQIGVSLSAHVTSADVKCTQVYAVINYDSSIVLSKEVSSAITSGEYKVKAYADSANLTLEIDDVVEDTIALGGSSVPDNASDWVLMSNATPYMNYYSHSVGGTEVARYEPTVMLTGVTLVDGIGDNDGTITWGSNSNLSISYGAMVSSGSTEVDTSATSGFEMQQSFMPATWFAMGENIEDLPFYDMVYDSVNTMDFPNVTEGIQTIYFIVIIGISFAVMLGMVMFTRSALIGFLGMIIVLFVGSSMTIIPMWIPFAILLVGFGIMYLYRQVAY
jgi:hypothetical protein